MPINLEDARFLVLSDIHGNLEALDVALQFAELKGVRQILFLGDLLGYFYSASECLQRLRLFNTYSVRGNHEDMYLNILAGHFVKTDIEEVYGSSLFRTLDLDDSDLNTFVSNLPISLDVHYKDTRIRIAHGDPINNSVYVYPDSPRAVLDKLDSCEIDFLFLGNTHRQMIHVGQNTIISNPGSVGMSKGRLNNVQFAYVDIESREVSFLNIPYNPVATINQVKIYDPGCKILSKYLK